MNKGKIRTYLTDLYDIFVFKKYNAFFSFPERTRCVGYVNREETFDTLDTSLLHTPLS